jgi:hypothetical protein
MVIYFFEITFLAKFYNKLIRALTIEIQENSKFSFKTYTSKLSCDFLLDRANMTTNARVMESWGTLYIAGCRHVRHRDGAIWWKQNQHGDDDEEAAGSKMVICQFKDKWFIFRWSTRRRNKWVDYSCSVFSVQCVQWILIVPYTSACGFNFSADPHGLCCC